MIPKYNKCLFWKYTKLIYQFSTEEKQQAMQFMQAADYYCSLFDILQLLRNYDKHGWKNEKDSIQEVIYCLRQEINDIVNSYNISF